MISFTKWIRQILVHNCSIHSIISCLVYFQCHSW